MGRVEGLGEVVIHSGFEAAGLIFGQGGRSERDDGKGSPTAAAGADRARGLIAIHLGHVAIHQDHIVDLGGHQGHGPQAVASDLNATADPFEKSRRHPLIYEVIFGEQNAQAKSSEARIELDMGG